MEKSYRQILDSFEMVFKEMGAKTSIERNTYVKVMAKNGKDYAWVMPWRDDYISVKFFNVFDFNGASMTRMSEDMFKLKEPTVEGLKEVLGDINESLNF